MEANPLICTAEELAEIRERESKATPGPWKTQLFGSGTTNVVLRVGDGFNEYGPGMMYVSIHCYNAKAYSDGSTEDGVQQERYHCADFIAAARTDIPRLLATVEAALLSIEDQAAIIADRDATVEALRAENERLKTALREVRTAFDDYQGSEGCECCEKSDHTIHAETMARLMKEPEA